MSRHTWVVSILLGEYIEVELLEPMVILCVPFPGAAILFSTVSAPFYIPTSKVALCPRPRLCLLFSDLSGFIHLLIVAVLVGGRRFLIWVFMCISLVRSNTEHLSICPLAICMPSWENCPLPMFLCVTRETSAPTLSATVDRNKSNWLYWILWSPLLCAQCLCGFPPLILSTTF